MLSGPTCRLTHLTSTSLGSKVARSSSVCTPASGTYTCSAVCGAIGVGIAKSPDHPTGKGMPQLQCNVCEGVWLGIAATTLHLCPTNHTTPCKGMHDKLLGAVQLSTASPHLQGGIHIQSLTSLCSCGMQPVPPNTYRQTCNVSGWSQAAFRGHLPCSPCRTLHSAPSCTLSAHGTQHLQGVVAAHSAGAGSSHT